MLNTETQKTPKPIAALDITPSSFNQSSMGRYGIAVEEYLIDRSIVPVHDSFYFLSNDLLKFSTPILKGETLKVEQRMPVRRAKRPYNKFVGRVLPQLQGFGAVPVETLGECPFGIIHLNIRPP